MQRESNFKLLLLHRVSSFFASEVSNIPDAEEVTYLMLKTYLTRCLRRNSSHAKEVTYSIPRSIFFDVTEVTYPTLQFLNREPFEVEGLVPPRVQRAPLDLRLEAVLLVREQSNSHVRV